MNAAELTAADAGTGTGCDGREAPGKRPAPKETGSERSDEAARTLWAVSIRVDFIRRQHGHQGLSQVKTKCPF